MPKIKDLGVKVIPETMRPPEMGPGGGGPHCQNLSVVCACSVGLTHQCQPTVFCTASCAFPTVCHPTVCHPTFICVPTACHPSVICTASAIGTVCACSALASIPCGGSGCGAISPVCGGSIIDPGGPISIEEISALKDQLRQSLRAVEEVEKNLGPKTAEAIDARTKEIEDELAQLKQRRKDLK